MAACRENEFDCARDWVVQVDETEGQNPGLDFTKSLRKARTKDGDAFEVVFLTARTLTAILDRSSE
jgi:hypothetical protein